MVEKESSASAWFKNCPLCDTSAWSECRTSRYAARLCLDKENKLRVRRKHSLQPKSSARKTNRLQHAFSYATKFLFPQSLRGYTLTLIRETPDCTISSFDL